MAKGIRWLGNQVLGFWHIGLLLFALQEVPYMVMPFLQSESNPIMHMQESSAGLNLTEKILGTLCVMAMVFLVPEKPDPAADSRTGCGFCAAGVLLLNYAGWGFYFAGHQSVAVMLFFIVLLPPLYYLLIGLWRRNTVLTVLAAAFGIVHFTHVWLNLHG